MIVASLLLASRPPGWGLALTVGLLGAARPLLGVRNFLLYSVLTTPLILLMMESGERASLGILVDRVAATLAGSALVVAAGWGATGSAAAQRPG